MLIAHAPVGFIIGHFAKKWTILYTKAIFATAIISSLLPDIDMIYFHLIDNGQHHHHSYFTHWPLFWFAVSALSLLLCRSFWQRCFPFAVIFTFATFSHMVLDSIAAPMMWLAPFSDFAVQIVEIPASYSHWIISFLLHWTFLLEVGIWIWAVWVATRYRNHHLR